MPVRCVLYGLILCLAVSVSCVSDAESSRTGESFLSSAASIAPSTRPGSSLYFLNAAKGWVLLDGRLYETSDSGLMWRIVNHKNLTDCKSVSFANATTGWALCDLWNTSQRSNTVLATHDGGISWQKVLELPTPIYSVDFLNESVGFVSSRWLPMHRTTDGGKTWTKIGGIEGLNYVFFADDRKGWGYGGAIWHTEDSGENWSRLTAYEETEDLWNSDFTDGMSGWIVGKNQVWHGSNSLPWTRVKTLPDNLDFLGVTFLDSKEGWISASDGSLFHTTDGGSNWQVIARLTKPLATIRFFTKSAGYAMDSEGNLMWSRDGGMSWSIRDLNKQ